MDGEKIKPVSDVVYMIDTWFFKLLELFHDPQEFLKKVPLRKDIKVVDYGCGIGRYTISVAKIVGAGGKVFAIDIQPLAIRKVKERAVKNGLMNVETILIDSYSIGIEDSSIDVVLIIDTLHKIKDPGSMFKEMHRILKEDGSIFLDKGHMKIPEVKEIVESTGLFTITKNGDDHVLLAPMRSSLES